MRYNFLKAICLCCFMHTPTMQAGWLAPDDAVNLSASGQNASRPQIAVDGNGVATAIWRQNFGPNTAIQASTQTIPGLWSAPSNLSEVTFTNDPQIAVNANGIAAAVWRQTGLVGTVVQASTQTTSGVWPLPAETVAFNVGTQFANPQTAIDGNGIATVVWGHTTPGIIIQAFTETDIGVWPNPFTPVTLSDAVGDEANPQIAVNSDGIATAIWRRTNGGNEIIQARTETAPNVWSPTATLSQEGASSTTFIYPHEGPQIAVDRDGIATAIWRRNNGTNDIIQASTQTALGEWPLPINAVNLSGDGQDAAFPQIVVDGNGIATAVWQRYNESGNTIIQTSTKPVLGSWSAPIDLSASGQHATYPQIAIDDDGIATAVWERYNESGNTIIQAITQDSAGHWPDPAIPVNLSAEGQNADYPQIVVDAFGNATAVWQRYDGSNTIIQSSFNFLEPTITSVSPNFGPAEGGTSVTITGTNFIGVTGVKFGTNAAIFIINTDASITATSPAGVAGTVNITVTTPGGTSPPTTADLFTYRAPIPVVTSMSPTNGPESGGNPVIISGTNFIGVTDVKFGTASALFTVDSTTSITAIAPPVSAVAMTPSSNDITVDVTVFTPSGPSPFTIVCQYTYHSQSQPPLPPSKFQGTVAYKKHAHRHKYHLKAHWKPSPSNVSSYRIYKRSKVVATIPADSKLVFKTHLLYKESAKKFRVAAVNAQNQESGRTKLRIH